ncbi:MAG TPA: tripartite tricarboxylate transporter substrate binding protein [Burkholderiales bacterium]|nr:tripartite tricarboxylate transporter substrate binding protein [Burkholderiales bacterium]
MRVIAAVLLALAFTSAAQAQSYPNRPITVVVPFPPGGVADITARPFGAVMSRLLGQPVVIENKAGAGGALGHAYAARSKPDGYTLMMALSSIVAIPVADEVNGREPTYRMSDFAPIALISADPTVLMVPSEAKWKTLKDLIEDARANPGKISYSSSGIYGTTHTAGEMLAQAAGVKFLHVPYGGGGPAMKAAMANEVMFTIQGPSVAAPHVKGGKFRLLGSWGGKRIPNLPDVPTMKEQGYDAEFYIWAALFAPAGLPKDVAAKLQQTSRQVVQDPEFKKIMENVNTPIDYRDGAEFQSFLEQDSARLAQVIRKMGKTQ